MLGFDMPFYSGFSKLKFLLVMVVDCTVHNSLSSALKCKDMQIINMFKDFY